MQEFWIPAQLPIINPKICIKLMDADDVGSDETAGSILFYMKDLLEGDLGKNKFQWHNVYGSPLGQKSSSAKTLMNSDPEYASNWKGRVLIQCEATPTDKPLSKVCQISDQSFIEEG